MDSEHTTPRELTTEEIKEYMQLHAQAARNAIQAGFDGKPEHVMFLPEADAMSGVEVHAAYGYLIDQFLQSNSNTRVDEYGGSIENRIRFAIEVVDAIADSIGPECTAIRLSPFSTYQTMRMPDPVPTFSALIKHLVAHQPHLAYIHLIEPRFSENESKPANERDSNDFVREIWDPRPLVLSGGFERETALSAAERGKKNVVVAMGQWYTSNPDLPKRWMNGAELTPFDQSTFYTKGRKGYNDWAFSQDVKP